MEFDISIKTKNTGKKQKILKFPQYKNTTHPTSSVCASKIVKPSN